MKLSTQTIAFLKNFASINANLEIKPSNVISTIAEANNILATATLDETFTNNFGIYDLNEFNSMLALVGEPDLEFTDSAVVMKGTETSASYRYSDPSLLTVPTKEIKMPDPEITVEITQTNLQRLRKGAGILGLNTVSIKSDGKVITLEVVDPSNPTANTFVIEIDGDSPGVFDCQFAIDALKVFEGDYKVSISSKNISLWENHDYPIEYFIALEQTSTFAL